MRKAVVNAILFPVLAVLVALTLCYLIRCRRRRRRRRTVLPSHGARPDRLQAGGSGAYGAGGEEALVRFPGGEGLTVAAILEAPGEVVAKSAHSTLYRAGLSAGEAVALLRFVRPVCSAGAEEAVAAAQLLGAVQHPNLVPIRALYVGPRGEKLLVHPFYAAGSLRRFLQALQATMLQGLSKWSSWQYASDNSNMLHVALVGINNQMSSLQDSILRSLMAALEEIELHAHNEAVRSGHSHMHLCILREQQLYDLIPFSRMTDEVGQDEAAACTLLKHMVLNIYEHVGVRMHRLSVCQWEVKLWLDCDGQANGAPAAGRPGPAAPHLVAMGGHPTGAQAKNYVLATTL